MRTRAKILAGAALALAAAGCMRLDVFVFRPKAAPDPKADLMATSEVPAALREEIVDGIKAPDGTVVNAYLLKHEPTDGTPQNRHQVGILYCHGNNTHIGTTVPRVDALWKLGYTVLVHDARGWGKTTGEQTEAGVYADTKAAREYLEKRADLGMSPESVALYGRSLGTALCGHEAADRSPKALVLESPISSAQQMIDDSLGLDSPGEWYVDLAMDNYATIPKFTGALLIMHGEQDDYVQPKYGQRIHELSEGHAHPNDFWLVPGKDHGDVPCVGHSLASPDNGCEGGFSAAYIERLTRHLDTAYGVAE